MCLVLVLHGKRAEILVPEPVQELRYRGSFFLRSSSVTGPSRSGRYCR